MPAAVTVYLSSTFRDLKAYREAVLSYFRPLKDSFRVLNMEDYVAEDRSAWEKCCSDVQCCDLYILLLGNSYGSIAQDPKDAAFNHQGYSYTELEYIEARKCSKEVFVFKASTACALPADAYATKLEAFWAGINGILSPREFDSPLHLAVQVAQSISRRFIKSERINEKLAYLCDRQLHNAEFLLRNMEAATPFRRVVVHGPAQELCDNFINRLSFYNLSFDDRKLGEPVSFDDFLSGNNYAANLQRFLLRVYGKLGVPLAPPLSISALYGAQLAKSEPLVMAIGCDVEMLAAPQMAFLKQLAEDCKTIITGKPGYLFLCLEEDPESRDPAAIEVLADEKAEAIKALLPPAEGEAICLPRLEPIKRADIKSWLQQEVTPDEGTALQIMSSFFADLPKAGITMATAHTRIGLFIKKMNTHAPETEGLINLY